MKHTSTKIAISLVAISAALSIGSSMATAQDELCYLDAYTTGKISPSDYGTKASEVATYIDLVKHRAACGMTDASDRAYFDAVATGFGCGESQQFSARFDQLTGPNPTPAPDGAKENFSDPAKYDEFCAMVQELDPAEYADPDGLNPEPFSAQDGLLGKINIFVGQNANG